MNHDDGKTLDPHARQLLALARRAGHPPLQALTPEKARAAYAASWEPMQSPGGEVASVQDITIDGPGGALALRVYRGKGVDPRAMVPCLLYLHGGGWVIGNLESHDRLCRRLANVANLCVVAVDYRLAPEHPFPAALDDGAAALNWVFEHAAELVVDANALGVGGDSAGGNLAASLALLARDGLLPALAYQVLIYPALDLTAASASYQSEMADLPLSAQTMHYFIGHYLPNAKDRLDWRASPLLAHNLAGVAPALVMTVAHDPLCDEGRAYAQRLDAAGVRVTALHFNDHMHGLLGQGRMVPAADVIGDFVFRTVGYELYRAAARRADSP
jgi:acetyl esterase